MDITDDTATTLTKQLMNDYDETHASTIAVMKVPPMKKFLPTESLLLKGKASTDSIALKPLSKKPAPEEAPSDLAIIGRYLLTQKSSKSWKTKKNQALEMKFN